MSRLSLDNLALIAGTEPDACLADLARRLGQPYITVAVSAWRMRRAGGWYCRIEIRPCPECGRVLVLRPGGRRCHAGCRREQVARRTRRNRQRARLRERPMETRGGAWASLSAEQRAAQMAYTNVLNRSDQALTRAQAGRRGAAWTDADDAYLLEHWRERARDQALALGRTLWSVRRRRTYLAARGAVAGVLRTPAPTSPERAEALEREALAAAVAV